MTLQRRKLTLAGSSIREFCELDTPILMFDKDGAFAVATLKDVRNLLRLEVASLERINANLI